MQSLIDGDLVAYRCAASAENDGLDIAVLRADKLMRDLLEATSSETYRAFLTGSSNFRKQLDPEYKANRKDTVPPQYLQQVREYLVVEWKAEVQDGIEADDALGIYQNKYPKSQMDGWSIIGIDTIICSLDKDLLQVPGKHYRWQIGTNKWTKEAEFLEINYIDGLRSFYKSSLVGDKSDNIRGIQGIGSVRAEKALRDSQDEQSMFNICRSLYNDDERFIRNLKLLWIMREEGDVFDPVKRGLIEEIQEQV